MKSRTKGIYAALLSAFFLGMAPVFGKAAILGGLPPLAVVAFRTLGAALLLLLVITLFFRRFLYIYPAGLLGCLLAGSINGVGSLFYYGALGRIDASVGQLLYSIYPLFLVLWLMLDRQTPSRFTLIRLGLALVAIIFLTQAGSAQVDLIGMGMMLLASALYALHLPINQRVLYDMPAPTVTVYTLLAMSAVVVPVYLFSGISLHEVQRQVWVPVLFLTLVTFFSRIMLFMGIKHIGGLQTALLGLGELLVTIVLSYYWLGERFTSGQWLGAILLVASLGLVILEKPGVTYRRTGGWLDWLRPPGIPPISFPESESDHY
jgi:drug/metabolite transporter (DMT)-like permease